MIMSTSMDIKFLKKDQTKTKDIASAGVWFDLEEMGKILRDTEDSAIVPSNNDGWFIVIVPDLDQYLD